jgi:NAD(P)-dependent dehydrogenase (short-subunit alcohol dehydrogenase family)
MVASTRIAVAIPSPMSLRKTSLEKTKAKKTTTMIAAAAVITRAVFASPSATEPLVSPVRRYSFFHPDGLVVDYGAAKAALLNVAKALSQELGPKGIRINSVSPGPVATDLWLGEHGVAATIGTATGVDPETVREQAIASMSTGRFTTPEEVATLVALLASPRTANVTGSNYVIDGGLVKTM